MVRAITKFKANEDRLLTLLINEKFLIDFTINVIKRDEISNFKRLKSIDNYIAETIGTKNRFNIYSLYITLATQLSMLVFQSAVVRRTTISTMFLSPRDSYFLRLS